MADDDDEGAYTNGKSKPDPGEGYEDDDELFTKLKGWFGKDYDKSDAWRSDAKEDFAFAAGDQWTEEDKSKLRESLRPIITMNRIDPIIDSVSGSEVGNRQEVRYIPREQGDVQVNETLTSAAQWFRDQCDAEDEESDAFRDTIICGMGWTETRLDYEEEPDGAPKVERVDPLGMVWDSSATKRNLVDARRIFHIRRNVPLDEAKALINKDDFEDADYNASWVDDDDSKSDEPSSPEKPYKDDGKDDDSDKGGVTLVRCQWWERETIFRLPNPQNPQQILTMSIDEYTDYLKKMKIAGAPIKPALRGSKRVYRQAYLGAVLLESGPAPCPEHFSFNVITGKRDRNSNNWYGLCRGMKDPQRWANKWLSQSLHILNSTAKGGMMAERGAFDNDRDAEESWAKQDMITFLKPGSLSGGNPKVAPKPSSGIPAGFYQLMEFAISSIRDVSGVSIEQLGMREATQAASLEYQRKQSSMTILQPLFDSLRRYRKMQGRQMLYLITHYLSDGRLVKIVGKDNAKYVPLVTRADMTYDVIVDDSPNSPNQKEQTWAILQQILPVIGKMLPPKTWIALMEYSPLPTSAQEKIKASIQPEVDPATGQPKPPPPDPKLVEAQGKLAIEQTKVAGKQQLDMASASHEVQLSTVKTQSEQALAQQQAAFDAKMAQSAAAVDAMLEKHKIDSKMELERMKATNAADLAAYKAELMAHVQMMKPAPQTSP